jgi:NAD(P)-dependent dehydrogenase (short-subunit alcohol dehydrogenase family)
MVERLKGKVTLVTGAGSGVGRAAATIFAMEGAKIIATDIKPEVYIAKEWRHLYRPENTLKIVKETGAEAIYVEADLAKLEDIQRLFETTVDTYGRLDVMFINHGLGQSSRHRYKRMTCITEIEMDDWDAMINVNLKSPALCLKYGIPHMTEGGSVVITASVAGLFGVPGHDHYSASKGGLIALARSVAMEYAPKIRVNVICPGSIDTPMHAPRWQKVTKQQVESTIPLKRLGRPEDVAYMALFLASDEASYVTGQIFIVDGGASVCPHL